MKTLITVFAILLTPSLFAQTSEDFVGQWNVQWTQTQAAMSGEESARFESLPESVRTQMATSFSTRQYTLESDGDLAVQWQSVQGLRQESGQWQLNTSGLIVLSVGQQEYSFTWEQPEANKLVLTMQNAGGSALVSKIILNRQQ